jgi:hypothetical protein
VGVGMTYDPITREPARPLYKLAEIVGMFSSFPFILSSPLGHYSLILHFVNSL